MKFKHALLTSAALLGFLVAGSANAAITEVALPANEAYNNIDNIYTGPEISATEVNGQITVGANKFLVSNFNGTPGAVSSWLGTGDAVTIKLNLLDATTVYTLINTVNGEQNVVAGSLVFKDNVGDSYTYTLKGGTTVRNGYSGMAATSVTATNTYDNFLIDEQTIALPTVFASHVLVSMTISTPNTADFSPLGQPYIGGLDVVTVGNGIVATPELPTYVMGLFGLGGIALLRRRQLQA